MFLASPEANIWIIGHSLGGALASLMGITCGTPVVAFESPGERMAATRLDLPSLVRRKHLHSSSTQLTVSLIRCVAIHPPRNAHMPYS